MTFLFWCCSLIIGYTYIGYPLSIAIMARLVPRRVKCAPWKGTRPPIAIVMAVHNAAPMLASKLAHLLSLDPHLVHEIIVVSDGSTDETNGILRDAAVPRLRVIALAEQEGKASALNHGLTKATAEIILFVDVRPRIEPGALPALLSNFADPTVGCVAGELMLQTAGHDAATSAVSDLYWRYEQWIRNNEALVDSPTGVYGGFYAVRRSLVTPAPQGLILDDMFQPLSVIRQGFRSVLERRALVVDRWPTSSAGEFQRKVRTISGNFQLVAMCPWLLTPKNRVLPQLISHKLLRLIVPYCFLAVLATSFFLTPRSTLYLGWGVLQSVLWLGAALSLRFKLPLLHRVCAPAGALLVLNAAAVAGLSRFLFSRGPLWKTWSPTAPQLLHEETDVLT